jgi:hypothetical protein
MCYERRRADKDSIPGTPYEITMSRFQNLPPQAMERLMKQAQNHLHPQSALHPLQVRPSWKIKRNHIKIGSGFRPATSGGAS